MHYYSYLEQSPTSRQNVQSPPCRGSQLVVVRNYSPKYFDEIELKEKEIIAFMDELETGWWRGMKVGNPSPVRNNTKFHLNINYV